MDDQPTPITSQDAAALGIEWDVEPTDLMSRIEMAEALGTTEDKVQRALVRPHKYAVSRSIPPQLVPGVHSSVRFHLMQDPSWRPIEGNTGRVWAEHGVIIEPTIDDLILSPEVAQRLGITENALRSALSVGQVTPRRYADLAALPTLTKTRRTVWSRRAVDALTPKLEERSSQR